MAEIASLIAPRPCVWEVGSKDKLIDPLWADDILAPQAPCLPSVRRYRDRVTVDRFDGGHVWNGKAGTATLKKSLQGS